MNRGVSVSQVFHPRSVSWTAVPGRTVVSEFNTWLAKFVLELRISDIGYLGIDQSGCEGMGCCWNPKEVS